MTPLLGKQLRTAWGFNTIASNHGRDNLRMWAHRYQPVSVPSRMILQVAVFFLASFWPSENLRSGGHIV